MTDVPGLLARLTSVLEDRRVPYAVIGGYAVRSYGIPRPTYDLDLAIQLNRDDLPPLLAQFEELGCSIPEPYRQGWVDTVASHPLARLEWNDAEGTYEVDLFLAETSFLAEIVRRRRLSDVEGSLLWIASPEDLVLLKLIANRHRDWTDVGDIFFTQSPLDVEYLRRWGGNLGITDRVERAITEFQNS